MTAEHSAGSGADPTPEGRDTQDSHRDGAPPPGHGPLRRHGDASRDAGELGRDEGIGVMTRNLYLGAQIAGAIGAPDIEAFVTANGQILRQVTANDFPTRAKGLADEIRRRQPDLVGLQEVALWRTGPPSLGPVLSGTPTAAAVRCDYLQVLLEQLNAGDTPYDVVVSRDGLDLEGPADENGIPGDGPDPSIADAEVNGRLTLRDVILARRDAGVETADPQAGTFEALLSVPILGTSVPVRRGWTAVDVRVRGGRWFRFVNTHLEAFDPQSLVPSIRAQQAAELVAPAGPATSRLPVVLVGDLNSDDDTVPPGAQQAYRTLTAAGMTGPGADRPLGCCIQSSVLREAAGGSLADFDHRVDHVMTRDPAEVELADLSATGLLPVSGLWNSDHLGLCCTLRFATPA